MDNLILIVLIVGLVGSAIYYIYRAKKKGQVCIGCPYAKNCKGHKCTGSCSESIKEDK